VVKIIFFIHKIVIIEIKFLAVLDFVNGKNYAVPKEKAKIRIKQ